MIYSNERGGATHNSRTQAQSVHPRWRKRKRGHAQERRRWMGGREGATKAREAQNCKGLSDKAETIKVWNLQHPNEGAVRLTEAVYHH
jgi:hypothetical protein